MSDYRPSGARRVKPNPRGLTPLQHLLGEVRRVCDLARDELTVREFDEFLEIVTALVARLNPDRVQREERPE